MCGNTVAHRSKLMCPYPSGRVFISGKLKWSSFTSKRNPEVFCKEEWLTVANRCNMNWPEETGTVRKTHVYRWRGYEVVPQWTLKAYLWSDCVVISDDNDSISHSGRATRLGCKTLLKRKEKTQAIGVGSAHQKIWYHWPAALPCGTRSIADQVGTNGWL